MWIAASLIPFIFAASCAARRYYGQGLVLDVNHQTQTLTVSHDRIPGFMDAMVMPLRVRKMEMIRDLVPGDRIHFRMVLRQDDSSLDYLRVLSAPPVDPARRKSAALSTIVRVGELVPDFRLTDQFGRVVRLSEFRGKVLAVNFIYSRCPLPDYCPRMTAAFSRLKERFKERLGTDLALLSLTFDPDYDTPEVLRDYARSFRADVAGWHFLTGNREEIARVAGCFGLEYWPDEGAITHNLHTGLIDRSGRLAANVEGKDFSAQRLADLVAHLLQK